MIAVLFARRDSVYKSMPGLDVYDIDRDARSWAGGHPCIAHPPCRAWGNWQWKAKPRPDEKQLAVWAVGQIRANGGILEHPSTSKLWPDQSLPAPGAGRDEWGGWTLEVFQSQWGHRALKKTRLYIVGAGPDDLPAIPPQMGLVFKPVVLMGRDEREKTPTAFAAWLVDAARRIGSKRAAA